MARIRKDRVATLLSTMVLMTVGIPASVSHINQMYTERQNNVSITVSASEIKPVVQPVVQKKTTKPAVKKDTRKKPSRGGQVANEANVRLLARLIHGEAGVESMAGKLAVGTVIMNRMDNPNQRLFGGPDLKGVIYKDGQFDCVQDKSLWNEPISAEDIEAARKILDGYRTFNDSVVYYYNPTISTDTRFINSIEKVMTIGNHVFAKDKREGK